MVRILMLFLFSSVMAIFISGCSTARSGSGQKQRFEINREHQSTHFNSRIRQIILHYTVTDFERSLKILSGATTAQVSSHYLINDLPSAERPDYIYQLLPEEKRAWHAGLSRWGKDTNLNNTSIGIEIVNTDGNKHPYPDKQIEAVIELLQSLVRRYDIDPVNVLAHSDIAPTRKNDPGALFPWQRLYENGIGAWYDAADVERLRKTVSEVPSIAEIKSDLSAYGYAVAITDKEDDLYRAVVMAFQRHFAPQKIDGVMSLENVIILKALLKKYRPGSAI